MEQENFFVTWKRVLAFDDPLPGAFIHSHFSIPPGHARLTYASAVSVINEMSVTSSKKWVGSWLAPGSFVTGAVTIWYLWSFLNAEMHRFIRYLQPFFPWHQYGQLSMLSKSSEPSFRLVYPILDSPTTRPIKKDLMRRRPRCDSLTFICHPKWGTRSAHFKLVWRKCSRQTSKGRQHDFRQRCPERTSEVGRFKEDLEWVSKH